MSERHDASHGQHLRHDDVGQRDTFQELRGQVRGSPPLHHVHMAAAPLPHPNEAYGMQMQNMAGMRPMGNTQFSPHRHSTQQQQHRAHAASMPMVPHYKHHQASGGRGITATAVTPESGQLMSVDSVITPSKSRKRRALTPASARSAMLNSGAEKRQGEFSFFKNFLSILFFMYCFPLEIVFID